jgi:hypothetical protein
VTNCPKPEAGKVLNKMAKSWHFYTQSFHDLSVLEFIINGDV